MRVSLLLVLVAHASTALAASPGPAARAEDAERVYTTASTTLYAPDWGYFGSAVSGAGDVNGDGYADVVVGADVYDSYTGRAYVYLGSAGGLSTTPSVTLAGDAYGIFGFTTAAAGDINGDGYDDIIVGQEGPDPYVGRAYVYYGSPTGIAATADVILDGFAAGTFFGTDVGGAGDVNGDGYADVVVGALGSGTVPGAAYLYLGSAAGLATSPCATLAAPTGIIGFGRSADGAGDVNGDGYADVIVGAEGDDGHSGRAYVYHGGARCLSSKPATTLSGIGVGDYFGTGASGVGDVNGDGYDDVAVGAYRARAWSGRLNVYLGSASGVRTAPATSIAGLGDGWFGIHVDAAGDVNADGYADLIVGAPGIRGGTGAATVYEGSASGITTTSRTTLNGTTAGGMFGYEVSGAGDVNGDGLDDVLVGAYGADGGAGRAYLFEGY